MLSKLDIQLSNGNDFWGPWEWINPPMDLGTEYRTTERYLGKPVYVKLVDCGELRRMAKRQRWNVEMIQLNAVQHLVARHSNAGIAIWVHNRSLEQTNAQRFTNANTVTIDTRARLVRLYSNCQSVLYQSTLTDPQCGLSVHRTCAVRSSRKSTISCESNSV